MAKLSSLKQFDPRTYWKDEAKDFTPWLFEHITLLGEALQLPGLVAEGMEVPVGNYKADIVGKDTNSGRKVVIENQLEGTNHNHLGQIITYASGLKATVAVWVVKEATDEHRQAIQWLNEIANQNAAFFLVEIQLWQIGDSDFAPRFNVVEEPNKWAQIVEQQEENRQRSAFEQLNCEFWTQFNNTAFGISDAFDQAFKAKNVTTRQYLDFFTLRKRKIVLYIHTNDRQSLGIRTYIQTSHPKWLEAVSAHKEEIEKTLGTPIYISDSDRSDMAKWRGFWVYKPNCPIEDRSQWSSYIRWFVEITPKIKTILLQYAPLLNEVDDVEEESTAEGEEDSKT